jgi:hypothetical protein
MLVWLVLVETSNGEQEYRSVTDVVREIFPTASPQTHLPILSLLHFGPQPLRSPQSFLLHLLSFTFTLAALLPRRGLGCRTSLDRLSGKSGVLGRSFCQSFRVCRLTLGLTGGEGGELGLYGLAVRGVGGCGYG